jgi:hypothetical protein
MTYTAQDLSTTLAQANEAEYVRFAADWLTHGDVDSPEPDLTGMPVVDALVASVVAHAAAGSGRPVPRWTNSPARSLDVLWHPGGVRFFAYSLAHAPAEFLARGLVVEQDSLVSV